MRKSSENRKPSIVDEVFRRLSRGFVDFDKKAQETADPSVEGNGLLETYEGLPASVEQASPSSIEEAPTISGRIVQTTNEDACQS